MAQIIRHRKGVLESVASATKRKAELLVVTGSSVSAIDTGLLFVGTEGGAVTPANKILTGATTPDLTGAAYDTSIDGIPFYNTSEKKYYILKKGGNVEVQATANTGGTGIVSSSAQIDGLGFLKVQGDSVVSGSSQITIGDTTGFSTFSSSLKASDDAQDVRLGNLETFSSSLGDGFATDTELSAVSAAFDSTIDALTTDEIAEGTNLYYTDVRVKTKLTAEGVISGSSQVVLNAADLTGFDTDDVAEGTNLYYTDTRVKTKLDADGVISGSSQVQIDSVTGFTAYSSSADSRTAALESAVGAGSNIDGRLTSLETFSASAEANDTELFATASSQQATLDAILLSSDADKDSFAEIVTLINSVDTTNDTAFAGFVTSSNAAQGVQDGRLTSLETESGSIQSAQGVQNGRLTSLEAATGSIATAQGVQDGRLDNLELTTASIDTAQGVQDDRLDGLESFSSSLATGFETTGRGIVSGSTQTIAHLVGNDIVTNGISGSSLDITGNAKIDGNLVLGGNITIGDATSDTISFGGEITSDIIPSVTDSIDLGSATRTLAEVHSTNFFGTTNGTVNATNNIVSSSASTANVEMTVSAGVVSAELKGGVVSGSAQVVSLLADQATDFGTGRVSGDDFGDTAGTSTFTGSFQGDGSGLSGLVTDLRISGSTGNDVVSLLNDDLSFAGGTAISVDVTDNTITVNASDASTAAKGIASFSSTNFAVASGNVTIVDGGVAATKLNADVAGTGISLNGADNSIEVDYGSSAGNAVQGNTTISVSGTANEIEITGTTSQAIGGGVSYTVGLPSDVTIGNDLSVTSDAAVGGNLTVTGNLSVLGTTTTVDSTTVQIGDNVIELNYGGAQTTAGLLVTDSTAPNTASGSLLWNGTNDVWTGGALGSEKEFARLNSAPTANFVQKSDANGLLVDSVLSDDGTDATFSGDVIVDGLSTSSFLFADANKQLTSIVPSNAGDVIQWNGASFVASNELDGGTF